MGLTLNHILHINRFQFKFHFFRCHTSCHWNLFVCFLRFLHVHRSSENDLTFHFFGAENDSIKLREAINRMVEKGRIGNFTLVSSYYGLQQEPGLVLQVWFIFPNSTLLIFSLPTYTQFPVMFHLHHKCYFPLLNLTRVLDKLKLIFYYFTLPIKSLKFLLEN